MYEVPENYKAIVGIYGAGGAQITEFEQLLPRTIKFDCIIPNEM